MAKALKVLFVLATLLPFSFSARAQERWTWPEKPQNLQVLPNDWPGSRLAAPMRGFANALGVRCSHCHVGQEGEPLSTYDFASDDNPNKERAREMLRMLGSINDHLDKIEPSGDRRVNMWCHTCHRGRSRPLTLAEELGERYRKEGITSALAHYRTLRNEYYGKGAYDFSERALNDLGYQLLGADQVSDAIQVFALNTEQFSDSANVWDSLGEAHMKAGHRAQAIRHYEKSLSLDPNNQNARDKLTELRGGNR